jgi:pSer/pThr/pTyr-binding forkhead associated (FHA) protein/S1-C subfamily serine protease
MITLTHLTGQRARQSADFDQEIVRIGRHPGSDVVFDADDDLVVGRHHAEIRVERDAVVIHDLESRNGTFVNGRRISEPTELRDGNVLQFGEGGPKVRCTIEAALAATMVFTAETDGLAETRVFNATHPGIRLEFVGGHRAGTSVSLTDRVITFGRRPECTVHFDDPADRRASGVHAEMRLDIDGYVLSDKNSTNGTFVNGERIEQTRLSTGDVIQFGKNGPKLRAELGRDLSDDHLTSRVDIDVELEHTQTTADVSYVTTVHDDPSASASLPVNHGLGHNTVQLMIRDAVEVARQNPGTQILRAVVAQATHQAHRTTRMYAGGILTLLLLASGGLFYKSNADNAALRENFAEHIGGVQSALESQLSQTHNAIDVLEGQVAKAATREEMEQINQLVVAEQERAQQLQQQLASARQQIEAVDARSAQAFRSFRHVASEAAPAMFMIGMYYPDSDAVRGFCSGFAVRPDGLVLTNAHCEISMAEMLSEARSEGIRAIPIVIQNGDAEVVYEVTERRSHPAYHSSGIDVAYLRVDARGRSLAVVSLAPAEELASINAGYEIAVYGYPGEIMDPYDPGATLLSGTVGRLVEGGKQIQHSALTSKGTSGSPILNLNGQVVGINASGIGTWVLEVMTDRHGNVMLGSDGTPAMQRAHVPRAGLGFGIHGDYLAEWLRTL